MKGRISKSTVDALRPGDMLADKEIRGLVARRLLSGVIAYGFRYRDKRTGKRRWLALGLHGSITADEARVLAKKRAGEVADNRDPAAELERAREEAQKADHRSVNAVLDAYLLDARSKLRCAKAIERAFERLVRPRVGTKSIYELRRSHIKEMLDAITRDSGPVMADRTLGYLRRALTWHAVGDDGFNSPIVRGMMRTKSKERARDRVLNDEEIRDLWRALDSMTKPAPFPPLLRALLLTGLRRNEVARMAWIEVASDVWTVPAARMKAKRAHEVPLTAAICATLGERQEKGFVFSTTSGDRPFSGFGAAKRDLDKRIAKIRANDNRDPMPRWTLHDLRRTARSLMSRAGVDADIAERVLAHALTGVRGVYDRYNYRDEKREALERLAALVERILNPGANVAELRRA